MHRPTSESDRVSMSSPGSSVYSSVASSSSAASSHSAFSSNRTVSPPPLRFFEPARSCNTSSSEEIAPIADPGQVNWLCMHQGLPKMMQPDVAQVNEMMNKIQKKSNEDKARYFESRREDLEVDQEKNPNKGRVRGDYKCEKEAAERIKNNDASRGSRLKKKKLIKESAVTTDFHRQENGDMYFLHNWMEQEVYFLESMFPEGKEPPEHLFCLRRMHGFF